MSELNHLLNAISRRPDFAGIGQITHGIEKESLRINTDHKLASSEHPRALGSALTHPHITTDYSEALLEFITEPFLSTKSCLQQLEELHAYTYGHLADEYLWASSMPCVLGSDNEIPIAQYGTSNSGRMKSVYRLGLGHRYGRSMQTIAGIHYNFSVSDSLWQYLAEKEQSHLPLQVFKTQGYFRLIRNFRRYFWLLLYLFGASPGVCSSFVRNKQHQLVPFNNDPNSLHKPYATSLRMGDLGYQSSAQDSLIITYNCLDSYIRSLCCAITTQHPQYASIGIKNTQGHYQQLNDALLQIENEFYSVIRPKRTAKRGETALAALENGGIEYIEVRCLDINPYEPTGISESQMHFMDTFLIYCLLTDSPASDEQEYQDIQENQKRMVYEGRDPKLMLIDNQQERPMRQWAHQLFAELKPVAHLLDTASGGTDYSQSLGDEQRKLDDASLTPSAQILNDMSRENLSFYQFAANISERHHQYYKSYELNERWEYYAQLAASSLVQQKEIENGDKLSFADYLKNYYSQYQCSRENKKIA